MNRRDWLRLLPLAAAAGARAEPGPPAPEIQGDDWGAGTPADIRALLLSVQREFTRHLPGVRIPGVRVFRHPTTPITLNEPGPDGRVRIGLHTGDTFWSQYSYQFAHEYVHVLAGHVDSARNRWQGTNNALGWLEETLCEAGSLFALRAMAVTWRTDAPYPNWTGYAPRLRDYADQRLADPRHQLPGDADFSRWVAARRDALRRKHDQREWNTLMAARLLPVFERVPAGWGSLVHFRRSAAGPDAPLDRHLAGWRAACPEPLRPPVAEIAAVFGVKV